VLQGIFAFIAGVVYVNPEIQLFRQQETNGDWNQRTAMIGTPSEN